jgi:hypothetical protein
MRAVAVFSKTGHRFADPSFKTLLPEVTTIILSADTHYLMMETIKSFLDMASQFLKIEI